MILTSIYRDTTYSFVVRLVVGMSLITYYSLSYNEQYLKQASIGFLFIESIAFACTILWANSTKSRMAWVVLPVIFTCLTFTLYFFSIHFVMLTANILFFIKLPGEASVFFSISIYSAIGGVFYFFILNVALKIKNEGQIEYYSIAALCFLSGLTFVIPDYHGEQLLILHKAVWWWLFCIGLILNDYLNKEDVCHEKA